MEFINLFANGFFIGGHFGTLRSVLTERFINYLQSSCVKTLYSNNGKSIDRQTQNDEEQVLVEFVMTGNRSAYPTECSRCDGSSLHLSPKI